MAVIYWFHEKGLYSGHPQSLGLKSIRDLENQCHAIIKDNEVIKNRFGIKKLPVRITDEAISDLYTLSLQGQYEFFRSM